MAKINPLYKLINTILENREIVIFLGGGASKEGKRGNDSFPDSQQLMKEVVKDFGETPKTKRKLSECYLEIIRDWERENQLGVRLSKFLEGEPGTAHIYLAALSIALFGSSNALLYLTKNIDDLIVKAFTYLMSNQPRKLNVVVAPFRENITGFEFKEIANNIDEYLKKGQPVIIKLFGDLTSPLRISRLDDLQFQPEVENKLTEWMQKPMIVIGYTFSDKILGRILNTARGNAPVFLINPISKIPESIKNLDRVYHIKNDFSNFVDQLLVMLQERQPAVRTKIDKILEFLDPTLLYPDFNSIKKRMNQCSKASIIRVKERMPTIEVNKKKKPLVPIPRDETSPNFERFVHDDRPLMVIIGDSGSGKSTLLYQLTNYEANELFNNLFITLFYDVHHLQHSGSLTAKLIKDFRCEERQLETVFQHFNVILTKRNRRLLIVIDGLNESKRIDPSVLKGEIESLAPKLPKAIKIIYSCRAVYWKSYIQFEDMDSPFYFDSKEFKLRYYSKKESALAFSVYQELFRFIGDFESLTVEFQEKISDPLMMRMLAEGYQRKKLPLFAPAVLIFKHYESALKRKFRGNPALIDFLNKIVGHKLEEVSTTKETTDQFIAGEIRDNDKFFNLFKLVKGGDPLVLLEDEGILSLLDSDDTVYRFTYDRFFEYLLGKQIGRKFKLNSQEDFSAWLTEHILIFQRTHFSFIQALKSEIIRRNIEKHDENWSFFDPSILKPLLKDKDAAIKNFTKEVLRELTFDADLDILQVLKGVSDNDLDWKYLAMDVASDSPRIQPVLLEGMFSGDKHLIRRCTERLSVINCDLNIRSKFEELVFSKLNNTQEFSPKIATGLMYYTAAIFSLEDHLGHDPFESSGLFWNKAFNVIPKVQNNKQKIKNILASQFIDILQEEGPLFFSAEAREIGMNYVWENMPENIRNLASELVKLVRDLRKPISSEIQRILYFFGSELKYWKDGIIYESNSIFVYKYEFLLAQWILIQRSQSQYDNVLEILETFVCTKFWVSIDFALSTLKRILIYVYPNNKLIIKEGFKRMRQWVSFFEKETSQFYDALAFKDPFSVNYIPIAQTAAIDVLFLSPKNGPVKFIEELLTGPNKKMSKLALLCTRYFWKANPRKILGTLELVLKSTDSTMSDWLNRILKEIYLVYPRLIEDFFEKNNVEPSRIDLIKFRDDVLDSTGFKHDADPLMKAFLLKFPKRRISMIDFYEKMLESDSLTVFCHELVDALLSEIIHK